MKKIKNKKKFIIRIIILAILISAIVFIVNFVYNKLLLNKFKNILIEHDYTNYSLVEYSNDTETTVYVKDGILLSRNDNITTWINVNENKRVVYDEIHKTAIVDENDDELIVASLNTTYKKNFFEESNQKFKYLGKKDGHYVLQFTNKHTQVETYLYLNIETNFIDKMIVNTNGYEFEANFDITVNKVTADDVEMPNLEEYTYENSFSSKIGQ